MGLCRQLKDEILDCPPVLVLTGRRDDAWLATWSRADGVAAAPGRPGAAARAAVAALLRAPARRRARPDDRPVSRPALTLAEVAALRPGRAVRTQDRGARPGRCGRSSPATATPAQIAGFAVALRAKGETVEELTGLADTMLEFATPIEIAGPAVDVVGSGGDRANTVNISTMAAIVAAGAGARVVKHGNRAASSACGAADVLEALGVVLDLARSSSSRWSTGRDRLPVRPALPPGAAARRPASARARAPDHVQLPRPAGQPGAAAPQAVGVADAADGRADGRGASPAAATRAWSCTAATGSTS